MGKKTSSKVILEKNGHINWTMCPEVTSEVSALKWLKQMRQRLGKSEEKHDFYFGVIELIEKALNLRCLTLSDISILFNKRVEFLQIAEHCLLPIIQKDCFPRPAYVYVAEASRYLDVLLFIAELHDPSCDRLRVSRRKYDMCCACNEDKSRQETTMYEASPSPLLATLWERERYNDKAFTELMSNRIYKIHAPYWMVFVGNSLKDNWFFAFDENFTFSPQMSLEKKHMGVVQYGKLTISDIIGVECSKYYISMIGVPFIKPKPTTFHLWVDGIQWHGSRGRLNISIPGYYMGSHFESLRQHDMADIYTLLGKYRQEKKKKEDVSEVHNIWQKRTKERPINEEPSIIPSAGKKILEQQSNQRKEKTLIQPMKNEMDREAHYPVISSWHPTGSSLLKPRPNDNMLSASEFKRAGKLVFKIMKNLYKLPAYTSHLHMETIVSPWWQGADTLNKYLSPSPPMIAEDRKYTQKSIKEIVMMVDEKIDTATEISGDDKYLWARFCRELGRHDKGLKKVRNTGMAGRFVGIEAPPHKPNVHSIRL